MSRIVDIEPLLKKLKNSFPAFDPNNDPDLMEVSEAIASEIMDLESLPAIALETLRPVAQWIDIKDKLPEEYQSVLGVANGIDIRIVHYALGGFWMEDTTGEEYKVTHWMPLPEMPKEN